MVDSRGVVKKGDPRVEGNPYKAQWAAATDASTLADALVGADVFIGLRNLEDEVHHRLFAAHFHGWSGVTCDSQKKLNTPMPPNRKSPKYLAATKQAKRQVSSRQLQLRFRRRR